MVWLANVLKDASESRSVPSSLHVRRVTVGVEKSVDLPQGGRALGTMLAIALARHCGQRDKGVGEREWNAIIFRAGKMRWSKAMEEERRTTTTTTTLTDDRGRVGFTFALAIAPIAQVRIRHLGHSAQPLPVGLGRAWQILYSPTSISYENNTVGFVRETRCRYNDYVSQTRRPCMEV